jgi:hypothetical protein
MGDRMRHADKIWRPDGKRPLGKPKRQCENNTKIDLQDTG